MELLPLFLTRRDYFWNHIDKTSSPNGCWLWTASTIPSGYGQIRVPLLGRSIVAHKFSYVIHKGEIPAGLYIDHICHERTCVNPDHLRLATNKQNMENLAGLRTDNKSGYRGVSWSKANGKWLGRVTHNQVKIHVGYFTDLHEAAEAVRLLRNKLYTHNDKDRL